ncbi:MAG TPA: transcription antitermination factor NusB, partial [Prolixibacteraceae bacterium]|nr:transcription antitermination factor NusB [Prolixibacteraceae bacterium]
RTIRIKVLQTLYSYYSSPEKSINNTEKELFFSLHKTYDLYYYLLALLLEIADFAQRRIDTNLAKLRPSHEDLNPNTKFVDNAVIAQIRCNRRLQAYLNQTKLSWVNHPELVRELYLFLTESDFFAEYMKDPLRSYAEDRKLVDKIFLKAIMVFEELHEVLEEESIYWNDDIDFVVMMISKTLKNFNEESDENQPLMPMFKDEEDKQFAKDLYRKAVLNHDELRQLINQHSSNWDLDRIAFMDILIMQLALTEFLFFPSIPTKVSLNEYIELSKFYSTDKSRNFINGILDKALKELKTENRIVKAGRGLIGELE